MGGCESKASNTILLENTFYDMGNSTCECCAPKSTTVEYVRMICASGDTTYPTTATYNHIASCECQVCKG